MCRSASLNPLRFARESARRELEAAEAGRDDPGDRTYDYNVLPVVEGRGARLVGNSWGGVGSDRHDREGTHAMTEATSAAATSPSPFAGGDWFDPLEEAVRRRVRAFIEELLEEELEAALGRGRYERDGAAKGHRHGRRPRRLVTSCGPRELTVPRARLRDAAGEREWRSELLPAYRRLSRRAEALVAQAYLAGVNTRRVRRALAGLLAGRVGKDAVSRAWRRTRSAWEAWRERALAGEDVVRLILDGTAVKVRLDKRVTAVSLLVVPGVRRDGQKVVLAIESMGGESEAAWRQVLEGLASRGLGKPELVIVDGGKGLEAALAAVWDDVPVQRCAVHTIRTQSTVRLREALTPRRGAAQGDDMADLQAAIADDDALDDELQDRLLVGQRRLVQAAADAGAERRQVRPRRFGSQPLLA